AADEFGVGGERGDSGAAGRFVEGLGEDVATAPGDDGGAPEDALAPAREERIGRDRKKAGAVDGPADELHASLQPVGGEVAGDTLNSGAESGAGGVVDVDENGVGDHGHVPGEPLGGPTAASGEFAEHSRGA